MQGIVSVFESKTLKPHTTRSWDFLGFSGKVPRQPELESNIVVGMIDTGVWPESESFSDKGFGPPPKKWRGPCHNITCNNKIIGGRYYNARGYYVTGEGQSPRDVVGHGTHTASTVAGAAVSGVSLYGLGRGTARGGVPSARIAVYKVCWSFGCDEHDILAAFNDAIADGVDVISASIGGVSGVDYNYDGLAIGSFHAMQAGILTLASAGNAGPDRGTASNVAPWLVSVAASTIDRRFVTHVEIGDHERLTGQSINTFSTEKNFLPLILGRDAAISKNITWAARNPLATPMNATRNPDAELSYGAGQIDPLKAVNPGLVYDAGQADFVQMLCNQGYNTTSIRLMTGDQSSCSAKKGSVRDLNYPSMAAKVGPKDPFPVRFTRTVTNVGSARSTYRAVVSASSGIHVSVEPNVLSFHALNQKQGFVVTVSGAELPEGSLVSASVVWSDGLHSVRSPIVVLT
ncbi:hypothetical protein QJS10_CPB14g01672 [Acorus calamus]|uniref:Cucumisin n=1 Tax=Acorus calamus TaxID=4465 RepID=A0AAV9DDY3_ACOCL|nr:hypothetical protein QJS10_CPB14g01672 [Acorus calamus]